MEPAISRFRNSGAEDGTRTRDPHLGKVMLYQLSHFRVPRNESIIERLEAADACYWLGIVQSFGTMWIHV